MTFFSDAPVPPRPANPMAQVIAALVKRHGRWRVLRAALFAGRPLPRRKKRAPVPDQLRRDLGLPQGRARQPGSGFRDPIL